VATRPSIPEAELFNYTFLQNNFPDVITLLTWTLKVPDSNLGPDNIMDEVLRGFSLSRNVLLYCLEYDHVLFLPHPLQFILSPIHSTLRSLSYRERQMNHKRYTYHNSKHYIYNENANRI
jgi:hypothetical protein